MERYQYIKAIVDCGHLHWEYLLEGAEVPGAMSCDDDVEEWSEEDIIDVTMSMLAVPEDQRTMVQVIYF